MNGLQLYRASAGSGKTYTLVLNYLLLVLPHPQQLRNVLAVTFTHKATGEMRRRILQALYCLANSHATPFRDALQGELVDVDIVAAAREVLSQILHHYSHFHVHTLESFFHSVLMSFGREIGIAGTVQTELDADEALSWVVDSLLDELNEDTELQSWVTYYVFGKIEQGKSWNFRKELRELAGELLKESADEAFAQDGLAQLAFGNVNLLSQRIESQRDYVKIELTKIANQAIAILRQHELTTDDLFNKQSGPGGTFQRIVDGDFDIGEKLQGKMVENVLHDNTKWYTKTSKRASDILAIAPQLSEYLSSIRAFYMAHSPAIIAYDVLKRILLTAPLLRYMASQLRKYRDTQGILFLADVARLLQTLAADSEAPFVYEKIGNRYKYYLIDEFQDTSARQWDNLLPLVLHALASGTGALVVGDAKQAIYRWRSGDVRLILGLARQQSLAPFTSLIDTRTLDTNYRSGEYIVRFNNLLFENASGIVMDSVADGYKDWIRQAYDGIGQKHQPANEGKGLVHFEFVEKPLEAPASAINAWKESALTKTLQLLRKLKDEGYAWQDIALLVRKRDEAATLIQELLHAGIPALSSEALLVNQSPQVQALVSMLQWVADPTQTIAKLHLQFATRFIGTDAGEYLVKQLTEPSPLLTLLTQQRERLLHLQVYELCENLLEKTGWHQHDAYMLQFLSSLRQAVRRDGLDVTGVLRWWEEKQHKLSVAAPSLGDAVQVLTLHKSKGLEFPVVILPFLKWDFAPKHDSIYWGNSVEEPFASLGTTPLIPSKKLMDGPYGATVAQEFALSYLDNLNLLYVACTRAESRLYGFAPLGSKMDGDLTSAKLLQQVLTTLPEFSSNWDAASLTYRYGVASPPSKTAQTVPRIQTVLAQANGAWRGRLVVRTRRDEMRSFIAEAGNGDLNSQRLQAAEMGSRIHAILAKIHFVSDVPAMVQRCVFDGMLTQSEAPKYIAKLNILIAHPAVRLWFEPGVVVRTEQELLLPTGEVVRPDRLVEKGGTWSVIDFKTGLASHAHIKQVQAYAEVLRSMGYNQVAGYLLYIEPNTLVAQIVNC